MKNQKSVMKASRFILILSVLFGAFGVLNLYGQSDGSQQNQIGKDGTFVIRNARIVTVSGATIESGSVVISDGKIRAVGASVSIPRGAQIIDGRGLSVYPGMIDAGTNMGLSEIQLSAEPTVDVAEQGVMNANAKAIVGINPNSSHINVTRVNGVTSVLSSPSGGTISGQTALINLWGVSQEQMAIVPVHSLVVNFPRVTTFSFVPGVGPQQIDFNEAVRQRDRRMEELKQMFKSAEDYAIAKEGWEKDKSLPKPATDLRMDAMIPYVKGEKPIIFTVQREQDIKGVIKFVEATKVRAIIAGGQDAWKVADGLKKNNISVIYTNIYSLPVQDDDNYDYLFEAPSKMMAAGVKFCISTGDTGQEVRDLPYHAGLASAFGLTKEDALKSVTLYPAEMLGVGDRLGSIDVGKIANIVVTDGDLLEPRTNVRYLFINGRMLPLTSRHTELFDRFKDR